MKKYFLNAIRELSPSLFLNLKFRILKSKPSDINEHLQTLSKYAYESNTVFETGVRGVVSSWALLHGLHNNNFENKKIILNDIVSVNVKSISRVASKLGISFSFIQSNNLNLSFNEENYFDLTFIDTLHVYGQLKRELKKFAPLTKKYIILHDTTVDGDLGEIQRFNLDADEISKETNIPKNELLTGLWPAVEEFLNENKEWKILHRYVHNNGLTVLSKIGSS